MQKSDLQKAERRPGFYGERKRTEKENKFNLNLFEFTIENDQKIFRNTGLEPGRSLVGTDTRAFQEGFWEAVGRKILL